VTLVFKAWAFILRDLRQALSYRFELLLAVAEVLFASTIFFFLSQVVEQASIPVISRYVKDSNFFGFLLIGIAVSSFLSVSLNGFSSQIRQAQMTGTFEALLVTPTSIPTIIVSSTVGRFAMASFRVVAFIVVGALLFDLRLSVGNIPVAACVLALTVVVFAGIGILSASFVMVFKRGDPIGRVVTIASILFGGVYYPVEVLPAPLQSISRLVPITPSLRALRRLLLAGDSPTTLSQDLLHLALFALIILPLAITTFAFAVRWAKREGTLTHY
jgi:ABC-2 type transport system permease protein